MVKSHLKMWANSLIGGRRSSEHPITPISAMLKPTDIFMDSVGAGCGVTDIRIRRDAC